jgi:hypothetical protein
MVDFNLTNALRRLKQRVVQPTLREHLLRSYLRQVRVRMIRDWLQ